MKVPNAARALAKQLTPYGMGMPVGEPDGFGIYRTVEFTGEAAEYLEISRAALEGDARVESVSIHDGVAQVSFVAGIAADLKDPFPLADAALVATSLEVNTAEPGTEPAAKKAPAKKAAAKRTAKKATSTS